MNSQNNAVPQTWDKVIKASENLIKAYEILKNEKCVAVIPFVKYEYTVFISFGIEKSKIRIN